MNVKNPKAFIFGAGPTGENLLPEFQKNYDIISFIDNDKEKWDKYLSGYKILSPEIIINEEYDNIIIATYLGYDSVTNQLLEMGVPRSRIIISDCLTVYSKGRLEFLKGLQTLFYEMNIKGAIAEGGVFQGEYAHEINKLFPSHKLYLFDTFEGFDIRDVEFEIKNNYSTTNVGNLNITSEEMVLKKMLHPEMCIIRKGYFPDTAKGIDDNFCFVNLDFDLYQPMLAGLDFFYPRMVSGGVILVNDYYLNSYRGVQQAFNDFYQKNKHIKATPIGDGLSIAICC